MPSSPLSTPKFTLHQASTPHGAQQFPRDHVRPRDGPECQWEADVALDGGGQRESCAGSAVNASSQKGRYRVPHCAFQALISSVTLPGDRRRKERPVTRLAQKVQRAGHPRLASIPPGGVGRADESYQARIEQRLRQVRMRQVVEPVDKGGGRSVPDASVRLTKYRSRNPAHIVAAFQPVRRPRESLLGFAGEGEIESVAQRFLGTDRRVRAPGDQQPWAAAQPLRQPVSVPDPPAEESEADDSRREGFGLADDPISVVQGTDARRRR